MSNPQLKVERGHFKILYPGKHMRVIRDKRRAREDGIFVMSREQLLCKNAIQIKMRLPKSFAPGSWHAGHCLQP